MAAEDEPAVRTPGGNQLRWLRTRHARARDARPDVSVGVAASFTAEPLEAQIGAALLDAGFADPDIRFAEYNQLHQVCLEPSATLGDGLDFVILLWRIEDVFERQFGVYLAGDDDAGATICNDVAQLAELVRRADASSPATVIASTPPHPAGWGVDLRDPTTSIRVGSLHRDVMSTWLDALGEAPAVPLVDLDALQRHAGQARIFDAPKWAMYRQPYRGEFWQLLGAQLADEILRHRSAPPKCIIVDCDNTLWGGVVGEDGVGGLELGDAFPGRAFQEFQAQLRRLAAQGVMIAVVSKNNEADVLDVFESHDGMVLGAGDVTAWRVNWEPKPENIASIVSELNIGADSVVFIDDNPVEILEVSKRVPGVRCLLVPAELAELPDLVADSGLFRGLRASSEDRKRTEMMQSEAMRRDVSQTMDREDFLASLELRVSFLPSADADVARVSQLTLKTNQFNLTTVRRDEKEIRDLLAAPTAEVYAIRVADRFGDYGIVGVAIAEICADAWSIDTFLLSCRVLGRGVETAFLSAVASEAARQGALRLIGHYAPTRKNGQVADFYIDHDFTPVATEPASFALDLTTRGVDVPTHIDLAR
jgi:FkbH-like protein